MSGVSIAIYTDGAAKGNPGPGGYGVVMLSGGNRKELAEGFKHTTNNRMELLSVIVALETIKKPGADVTIYSEQGVDKEYLTELVYSNLRKFSGKVNAYVFEVKALV